MVQNCSKFWKWFWVVQKHTKWLQMDLNGSDWLQMDQMVQIFQKQLHFMHKSWKWRMTCNFNVDSIIVPQIYTKVKIIAILKLNVSDAELNTRCVNLTHPRMWMNERRKTPCYFGIYKSYDHMQKIRSISQKFTEILRF